MDDLLVAEVVLGRDAQDFLGSELGRYLLGRAQQEADEAMDQLKRINPWRRIKILQLQSKIQRNESIRSWLREIISSGRSAESALEKSIDE
jgi:hypothetical protein